MVEPKLHIVLQRRDCARNAARFYVLAIEPSLYGYGDAVLVRAWGRIGSLGRQHLDLYPSAGEAGEALEACWRARSDAVMRRHTSDMIATFGGIGAEVRKEGR